MVQPTLYINYGDVLRKKKCQNHKKNTITVSNSTLDTIIFPKLEGKFYLEWNGAFINFGSETLEMNQSKIIGEREKIHLYLVDNKEKMYFDIANKHTITFGVNDYDDIQITQTSVDFVIVRQALDTPFQLVINSGYIFHNFVRQTETMLLEEGDQLFFDGVLVTVRKEELKIISSKDIISSTLDEIVEIEMPYGGEYPDYHRSPRIIYREPEEKITIAKPTTKPVKPSEELGRVIVPPLVMIAAFILVSFFRPTGIYIVVMLSMTVVTVIYSIISYVKKRKKYRIDSKEREESYESYLKKKTIELYEKKEEQRHALFYHYPNVKQLRKMVLNVDSRIYEKTIFHHDFLTYRVGLGKVATSFELQFNNEEFSVKKDKLVEAAQTLYNQYQTLDNVPIVTDLVNGPVGYIGQRPLVLEQLQLLVVQIAFFHSYLDVQMIMIFKEEEKKEWEWMRMLPHVYLREVFVRGFVYHERSRDQVLNSLYQILKERKLAIDEKRNKNEKITFTPHYLVFLTDEQLILDHVVMEFFNEDLYELGVSLIFVQEVMQSLPEHVTTVIDIRDAKRGNVVLEKGELLNQTFIPDHFPENFKKEDFSRALAPIHHLQNLKNSIPEQVTFLEMYGVEKVEQLSVHHRWKQHQSYKSLAVPLGLRGKEDLVFLNLHEKAHGPHGLVAGTTGSGKSEIIQSYILSLAVNFHPHEVAFLLIDYKGGGMANLFKKLPHLLGTITNLDRVQSMRALASIKAELEKRQRLFGECNVNHIHQYQKLYKQGKVDEPMPQLFLISDEFAELKAEQPDFMKELVSTARIGRSLGIHLILATQKPSGVVDDQIWSNSKFKLALKVQNASDSNEILKTPDAADITLPGRAYLQVGNNEIYELFQSAWSGADYIPEKEEQAQLDTTIYAINELGQYDILTDDLSGLDGKKIIEKVPTELEAVIHYIYDYTVQQEISMLSPPWLPPLPERLYVSDIHPVDVKEAWETAKKPLQATVGLLDQPEMQSQSPLVLDLTKEGHVAVFSSPGYGKSTFLQTTVLDLARFHNPEQFHVYLLDFGANGLLPLQHLPHVADTFLIDEEEKIGKLLRRLSGEMKERKKRLSDVGVASIVLYEKASGNAVPHIVVVIDNYDAVRETKFSEDFESVITTIAREGASIGIHLVISAGRQNALKLPLLSNIKAQIALYMIDHTEARSVVGRTDIESEEIAGRGLIKLEKPVLFQAALPTKADNSLQVIEKIQEEAKVMDEAWTRDRPAPIPMVPKVIQYADFMNWSSTKKMIGESKIPFAVDFEEVLPMELNVIEDRHTLLLANSVDALENIFQTLIASISYTKDLDVGMIDNLTTSYRKYQTNVDLYAAEMLEITSFIGQLQLLFEAREMEFREKNVTIQAFVEKVRPMIVLITDVAMIIEQVEREVQKQFLHLLENGPRMRVYFIIGSLSHQLERGYDDVSKGVKNLSNGVIIGRISDQTVLEVTNRPYKEPTLLPYEAYYIQNRKATKIKLISFL